MDNNTDFDPLHRFGSQTNIANTVAKIQREWSVLNTGDWDLENAKALCQELQQLCHPDTHSAFQQAYASFQLNVQDKIEAITNPTAISEANLPDMIRAAVENLVEWAVSEEIYTTPQPQDKPAAANTIFIVSDELFDPNENAIDNLKELGYQTTQLKDIEDLEQNLKLQQPALTLVDIKEINTLTRNQNRITDFIELQLLNTPIVYVSEHDTAQMRIESVRYGGQGFLEKPVKFSDLKKILDVYVPINSEVKYKVMILDDDEYMISACSSILESAGFQTLCINDPLQIFNSAINFMPDVILLDMYMPQYNGIELANSLRQHEALATTPIVIMSGETNLNKQYQARKAGADDFLLKPFKPSHLLDTIYNRAQRSRHLNKLITRDALTGIELFPKIRERIAALIDSSQRHKLPFCLCILDLDNFKSINDTYGHLVGDGVLRNLSDFFRFRIRKSDVVTRYGGEEFILILPYTNLDNSLAFLDGLREEFAKLLHHANQDNIHVTFSAGIAQANPTETLDALLLRADEALYRAKSAGKNRICLGE